VESVAIESGSLKAWSAGDGEPVLVIHGALAPDVFGPMIDDPALTGYRFVGYRRRGHIDSAANVAGESIEDYAADAVAVLDHFGIDTAHVVGHSYGGRIALEVAHSAPTRVRTLALLEGGAPTDLVVPSAAAMGANFGAGAARFAEGDPGGALDTMLEAIGGPDSRSDMAAVLGAGWYDQAAKDMGVLFGFELGAPWALVTADLAEMTTPTGVLIGTESVPFFREVAEAVAEALPNSTTISVPGANHWLQAAFPQPAATALASFLNQRSQS